MQLFLAILIAFASTTLAAPSPGLYARQNATWCLSDRDAQDAADVFQELIQNYSDRLAREALTQDFVDYASGVNIIINLVGEGNLALNGPTFVGRKAFINGQGSQPEIPFQQLNLFHGCDSVSLRWQTTRSAAGQPTESDDLVVVGNVIMEAVESNPGDAYNFRIKTIYSEFNSAAWLINLGIFDPDTITPPPPPEKRSIGGGFKVGMI